MDDDAQKIRLKSEYTAIVISEDCTANGPRLLVESLRTKMRIFLDPLELECLTHCTHRDLSAIVVGPEYAIECEEVI